MSTRSRFPAFAVTFAAVYAVVYYFALVNNWALFSYGPAVGEWMALNHSASAGPTMYWYGWIATSAIAGAVAGLIVAMLPEKWRSRIWPGFAWLVPLVVIIALMHLLSGYFTR
jgi:hypothetical protein